MNKEVKGHPHVLPSCQFGTGESPLCLCILIIHSYNTKSNPWQQIQRTLSLELILQVNGGPCLLVSYLLGCGGESGESKYLRNTGQASPISPSLQNHELICQVLFKRHTFPRQHYSTMLGKGPGNRFPFLSAGTDAKNFEFQEVPGPLTHPYRSSEL